MNGAVRRTETGGVWERRRLLPVTSERRREGGRRERVEEWMRLKGEGGKKMEKLLRRDRGEEKKDRK